MNEAHRGGAGFPLLEWGVSAHSMLQHPVAN